MLVVSGQQDPGHIRGAPSAYSTIIRNELATTSKTSRRSGTVQGKIRGS